MRVAARGPQTVDFNFPATPIHFKSETKSNLDYNLLKSYQKTLSKLGQMDSAQNSGLLSKKMNQKVENFKFVCFFVVVVQELQFGARKD